MSQATFHDERANASEARRLAKLPFGVEIEVVCLVAEHNL